MELKAMIEQEQTYTETIEALRLAGRVAREWDEKRIRKILEAFVRRLSKGRVTRPLIKASTLFLVALLLFGCAGTGDYAGMSKAQWNDYERRYWSKENHW